MSDKYSAAAFPELHAAYKAMKLAQLRFQEKLAEEFLIGTRVRVNHYQGSYTGVVCQVEQWGDGQRVYVTNDATGKATGRYPLMDCNEKPCLEKLS